jgi:hypothetical protein
MIGFRWLAIGIAVAAILDPSVTMSRRERPPIDVDVSVMPSRAAQSTRVSQSLERDLVAAGFPVNGGEAPVARVLLADHPPSSMSFDVPIWAVDMSGSGKPGVRITDVFTSPSRAPGQSTQVHVSIQAVGVNGEACELQLEDQGIAVATARHVWHGSSESWSTMLSYRPPTTHSAVVTVRVRRGTQDGDGADARVDVRLPAERMPFRVLAYDASLSWPAMFVRRSLEGEAPFALSLLQRGSPNTATRAGAPPRTLSTSDLNAYDLVVVGGPEELSAREVDVLDTFVRDGGGAVAFVASRRPSGGYARLLGYPKIEERMTEDPVDLTSDDGPTMRASELLIARPSSTARVLVTAGPHADPVAFSIRRGDGVIVFSGALDAWRYRTAGQDGFARFWQSTLSDAAASVTPRLDVRVDPGLVAIGQPVRVRATLRASELSAGGNGAVAAAVSARVVRPDQHVDDVVRLWPSIEPGVFEGEWKPRAAGRYLMTVTSGTLRREVELQALEGHVERPDEIGSDGLALTAAASGGDLHSSDRTSEIVPALAARFPATPVTQRVHPMRSPWWCVPFALALCLEWGWRRLHGAR